MRVVLKKDACYHAAMLASTYVPENALNFPNWFHTSLSPEVPQAMACSPKVGAISRDILLLVTHFCFDLKAGAVLQRRLIILIGTFADRLDDGLRQVAYGSLAESMHVKEADTVVTLSAVDSLMLLLCDADFNAELMSHHAPMLFRGLFNLFTELTEGTLTLIITLALTLTIVIVFWKVRLSSPPLISSPPCLGCSGNTPHRWQGLWQLRYLRYGIRQIPNPTRSRVPSYRQLPLSLTHPPRHARPWDTWRCP